MVKVAEALNGGVPSSVTCTGTGYVPGACASAGVQETIPEAGSMLAPWAAPAFMVKERLLGGRSKSAAVWKDSSVPALTYLSRMLTKTGGILTSSTVTMNACADVRLGMPLSVTCTVRLYTPGP